MPNELQNAMTISAYGMRAQGERIRVISQNIANSATTSNTPDENPYTRQITTFKNEMDRERGMRLVRVDDIKPTENPDYPLEYNPSHPGANGAGYVRMPNVNPLIETMDMRQAQRSYEASLGLMDMTRNMAIRTTSLLDR